MHPFGSPLNEQWPDGTLATQRIHAPCLRHVSEPNRADSPIRESSMNRGAVHVGKTDERVDAVHQRPPDGASYPLRPRSVASSSIHANGAPGFPMSKERRLPMQPARRLLGGIGEVDEGIARRF